MKKLYNNQSGFTLIELLIVIAIIGILAVIVLAILNPQQQRIRAEQGVARSNIAKACLALQACANASVDGQCTNPETETELSDDSPANWIYTTTDTTVTGTGGNCTISCNYRDSDIGILQIADCDIT